MQMVGSAEVSIVVCCNFEGLSKMTSQIKCKNRRNFGSRFDCMFFHVMYVFQSESTLYSCLNVKELLARSRRVI